MAKIPPFKFGVIDLELEQFRDILTTFWNSGKYPITVSTSLPTSTRGGEGERVLFRPNSGGMTEYVYVSSAWLALVSSTT